MSRRRVVVTGMGIWSAIGTDLETFADNLTRATTGIRRYTDILDDGPIWSGLIEGYDPLDHFTADEADLLDRTAQFAILAARQALCDAGLVGERLTVAPERVALILGSSHGGRSRLDQFIKRGSDTRVPEHARWILLQAPHHQQTNAVACYLGVRGPVVTISSACSSSGVAISYGFELLQAGKADVVLVGGADAFSRLTHAGFAALGAVAEGAACGPFSSTIGISLGEGAGFLVLERLEHAGGRGARLHAELLSYGLSWDAHHLTEPQPAGEGVLRALTAAVAQAGVEPAEIDYINAHGTGTRANDSAESGAFAAFFQPVATAPVSASKSFTGHTLGASSVMGFIASTLCMNRDTIPPTVNFAGPRPGCELDYVPNQARPGRIRHFIANSAGFGGVNACVVGGRFREERELPARRTDRVGITGMGVISPAGTGVEAFLRALRDRRSGIGELDRFDAERSACRRAALVRDFNPRRLMPTLQLRRMDLVGQFATVAVGQALADAGLATDPAACARVGLVVGTTRGAVASFDRYLDSVRGENWAAAKAISFPKLVMSSIGGEVSTALGLKGIASTLVGGTTSGLQALIHAFEYLRQNDAVDTVVVVAADEVQEFFFRLFDRLGVLSGNGFGPYHPEAGGMVLGEGAVALVLERFGSAARRGGRILAELCGYGLTSDPRGFMGAAPEGHELERAARLALAEAGLRPAEVDVVYGHGRGLPVHDAREVAAFGRLVGRAVPVGCVMGNTGVAEAASGLFSVAAAVLGLVHGEAYPVVSDAPLGAALGFVAGAVQRGCYRRALVAGSTEQGNNAALVLGREAA